MKKEKWVTKIVLNSKDKKQMLLKVGGEN